MSDKHYTNSRLAIWRRVRHDDGRTYTQIGFRPDGTLFNPNGYPEDIVRAAVAGAEERLHARRSASAKKAAVTRAARRERLVYEVVERLKAGGTLQPGTHCEICGTGLGDPESEARGIGSDCWQNILRHLDGRAEATA